MNTSGPDIIKVGTVVCSPTDLLTEVILDMKSMVPHTCDVLNTGLALNHGGHISNRGELILFKC